ncbi:MAG: hypothetical protein ACT4PU_00565 [Planctomycetota bacterium]
MSSFQKTRIENARSLAQRWMERGHNSQDRLADHLGVPRPSLTKFLNGTIQPLVGRPKTWRIVELIERRCCVIDEVPLVAPIPASADPSDDVLVWFYNHASRCETLLDEQKYEPLTALSLSAELCAHSLSAPLRVRAPMATNCLLTLGCSASRADFSVASPDLLRDTLRRIGELESCILQDAQDEFRVAGEHRALGYASFARIQIGMFQQSSELVDAGMTGLLEVCRSPQATTHGHWTNLVRVVDRMFERGWSGACAWSEKAAQQAIAVYNAHVIYVLQTQTTERVFSHWRHCQPQLFERLAISMKGSCS